MSLVPDEAVELLTRAAAQWTDDRNAEWGARWTVADHLSADPRFNPMGKYLDDLEILAELEAPEPQWLSEDGSFRVVDLHGAPGSTRLYTICGSAIQQAKESGASIVGIVNSGGVHSLRPYVEAGADAGVVSIFSWNGGSYTVAPFGSSEPFFGTNPLAFAIPTLNRPIVMDMATSEIPFSDLMRAIRSGTEIPPRAGLDGHGVPTTNAREVYDTEEDGPVHLLPMGGGYKGSGIMLLLEVLTGALVGAKMSREASEDPLILEEFGGILISLDLARGLGSAETFRRSVTDMADSIRNSQPAAGVSEILLPGDAAAARAAERESSGEWLDPATESRLRELAGRNA